MRGRVAGAPPTPPARQARSRRRRRARARPGSRRRRAPRRPRAPLPSAASQSRPSAPARSPRFQASIGPIAIATSAGATSGTNVEVKVGRPDRHLAGIERVEEQRIQRAEQHRRAGGDQHQIVQQERAFARNRAEGHTRADRRRAPGIELRARHPWRLPSSRRMKTPRSGSVANACTEVSTPERTRKAPSRLSEKARMASSHGPGPERLAPLGCDGGMQKRRGCEPGHEGGHSPPGPRTRNRPTRARNRPTSSRARFRRSVPPRPQASKAAPSAPRPGPPGLR